MPNPLSGIISKGIDLSNVFDPLGTATKAPDVGIISAQGIDISNMFLPLTQAGTRPITTGLTGYYSGGIDLRAIFGLAPLADLKLFLQRQQLVSCQTVITLTANVQGTIPGHVFFWEQRTGTPVVFLEAVNQLSTSFTQTATKDDKVFRFYIDKGLPTEIHQDILITAISQEPLQIPTSSAYSLTGGLPTEKARAFLSMPAPGYAANGSYVKDNSYEALMWTAPNLNKNLIGQQVRLINTGNVTDGPILAPDTNWMQVIDGTAYQIDSLFSMGSGRYKVTYLGGRATYAGALKTTTFDTWEGLSIPTSAFLNLTSTITTRTIIQRLPTDNLFNSRAQAYFSMVSISTTRTLTTRLASDTFNLNVTNANFSNIKTVTDRHIISIG